MIIIDNIFPEKPEFTPGEVEIFPYNSIHQNSAICNELLQWASFYYSLDTCTEYELWHGDSPLDPATGEHVDKDEIEHYKTGDFIYPICSIVYYLEVEDLVGGELVSPGNWSVVPKTNRAVIFGPGVSHKVEKFTGTRFAVLVNPWAR